jgi:hypothetical protein
MVKNSVYCFPVPWQLKQRLVPLQDGQLIQDLLPEPV